MRALGLAIFLAACSSSNDDALTGMVPDPQPAAAPSGPDGGAAFVPADWYGNVGACRPEGCALTPASVSVGTAHTCVVMKDGSARCWGDDTSSQLAGSSRDRPIAGLEDIVRIGAGDRYACALARGGTVSCWGANEMGQVGDADAGASVATPTVRGTVHARSLFVGYRKTCIVRDDDARQLQCWGANDWGGFDPSIVDITFADPTPRRPAWIVDAKGQATRGQGLCATTSCRLGLDDIRSVSASSADTTLFVRRDGSVYSWLPKFFYPCAPNVRTLPRPGAASACDATSETEPLSALGKVRDLAQSPSGMPDTGQLFACAARDDGRVVCWGQNALGQLGRGSVDPTDTPPHADLVAVEGVTDAVQIAVGGAHACALTAASELYCWGANGPEDRLGTGAKSGAAPSRVVFR